MDAGARTLRNSLELGEPASDRRLWCTGTASDKYELMTEPDFHAPGLVPSAEMDCDPVPVVGRRD